MKLLRNNKGFTLIEIIVVIVILGIISAIAVPKVAGNIRTARINAIKQNLMIVQNAINASYATTGSLPSDTDNTQVNELLSGKTIESMAIAYDNTSTSGGTNSYTLTATVTGAPYHLNSTDVIEDNFPTASSTPVGPYALLPTSGDKNQVQITVLP